MGDDYFIATSTFDVFPGHPIYHSTNLVDWELIGHGLNRASQLSLYGTPSDGGIWAPALRYHDGTFYLVSTARYVYTRKEGPYSMHLLPTHSAHSGVSPISSLVFCDYNRHILRQME